jgi:hypothetical protein
MSFARKCSDPIFTGVAWSLGARSSVRRCAAASSLRLVLEVRWLQAVQTSEQRWARNEPVVELHRLPVSMGAGWCAGPRRTARRVERAAGRPR